MYLESFHPSAIDFVRAAIQPIHSFQKRTCVWSDNLTTVLRLFYSINQPFLCYAMNRRWLWASLTFLCDIILQVHCLSAVQGSPCYDVCDGEHATSSGDVVCTDDDFMNTNKGKQLQQCVSCLETSSFQNGWMTDPIFFLCEKDSMIEFTGRDSHTTDHLSFIQQTCLSGEPGKPISDCSDHCSNTTSSFSNIGGMGFFQSPFSYCSINSYAYESTAANCASCLQNQAGTVILGNCKLHKKG